MQSVETIAGRVLEKMKSKSNGSVWTPDEDIDTSARDGIYLSPHQSNEFSPVQLLNLPLTMLESHARFLKAILLCGL